VLHLSSANMKADSQQSNISQCRQSI